MGPLFLGLHDLMARQGQELFIAVDGLARRMRSLGFPAPERLSAIVERSEPGEEEGIVRGSAEDMIAQLATDHEAVARNIRTVATWAKQLKDQVTFNLLADQRMISAETIYRTYDAAA